MRRQDVITLTKTTEFEPAGGISKPVAWVIGLSPFTNVQHKGRELQGDCAEETRKASYVFSIR